MKTNKPSAFNKTSGETLEMRLGSKLDAYVSGEPSSLFIFSNLKKTIVQIPQILIDGNNLISVCYIGASLWAVSLHIWNEKPPG